MKPIDAIIRTSARTVRTYKDLARAREDGASDAARKKYEAAFEKAISELERALEAFASALAKKPAPAAPFDWMGAVRAVKTIVGVANKVRRGGKIEDVIEGEIVE